MHDAETEVRKVLAAAIEEATILRQEAETLLAQSRQAAAQERLVAQQRAKDIRSQADATLNRSTREARRIVEEAERRAEQIGGEAYAALRDKELLEQSGNTSQTYRSCSRTHRASTPPNAPSRRGRGVDAQEL